MTKSEDNFNAVALLSDCEFRVFKFMGQGAKTADIALEIGCAMKTVESHVAHIREKLGLDGLVALRWYATRFFALGYDRKPIETKTVKTYATIQRL